MKRTVLCHRKDITMRKNFGAKTYVFPMPVFVIGTYNDDGTPNAMTASWGGISGDKEISVCVSPSHRTAENIISRRAFSVSVADTENVAQADFVGIVSATKESGKMSKTGWTVIKSECVDAPLFDKLPFTLECRVKSYDAEAHKLVGEIINMSADESILDENGTIDLEKFRPITYVSPHHTYRVLGDVVGKAYGEGNKLK